MENIANTTSITSFKARELLILPGYKQDAHLRGTHDFSLSIYFTRIYITVSPCLILIDKKGEGPKKLLFPLVKGLKQELYL